jgi:hypothetical protein
MTDNLIINEDPMLQWKNLNGKEFLYKITNEDKASLYKACAYEGKPQSAICWTLIQRFAFIFPKYKSMNDFILSYVQPINPDWFPEGSKHLAYCERLQKAFKNEELVLKLADANKRAIDRVKKSTNKVESKYISIVDDIFNFVTTTPNRSIVHYCASFASVNDTELVAKQKALKFGLKRNMILVDFGQSFLPGTNWFYAVDKSKNFKVSIL